MRAEDLRDAIRAVPFRPFLVWTPSGNSVLVKHPEWIAYTGGPRTAIVTEPDDRWHILDVMLIDRIEILPPIPAGAPAPEPNGKD